MSYSQCLTKLQPNFHLYPTLIGDKAGLWYSNRTKPSKHTVESVTECMARRAQMDLLTNHNVEKCMSAQPLSLNEIFRSNDRK